MNVGDLNVAHLAMLTDGKIREIVRVGSLDYSIVLCDDRIDQHVTRVELVLKENVLVGNKCVFHSPIIAEGRRLVKVV